MKTAKAMGTWCKMSRKKTKRSGYESEDAVNSCVSCGRVHNVKIGGWVILASGQLICDPVDRHTCWEQVYERTQSQIQAQTS